MMCRMVRPRAAEPPSRPAAQHQTAVERGTSVVHPHRTLHRPSSPRAVYRAPFATLVCKSSKALAPRCPRDSLPGGIRGSCKGERRGRAERQVENHQSRGKICLWLFTLQQYTQMWVCVAANFNAASLAHPTRRHVVDLSSLGSCKTTCRFSRYCKGA